jgi:hypothetical protein
VDDSKIFRALKEAKEIVEGSEMEQYARIWDYADELLRSNDGSTVKVDLIQFQFHSLYCKKLKLRDQYII